MISNLKNDLNSIWATVIKDNNFDMLKNQISFKLKLISHDIETDYNLIFKQVSSFFFINENGELRFNFNEYEEGNYLELTSIGYYENGIGEILINSKQSWAKECYANANFVLEIWNRTLFIEAGIVEINDKVYNLKKNK